MRAPVHPALRRSAQRILLAASLAAALAAPAVCQGNPQGAQVLHGAVSLAMPDAATLNITNSPGAIINWQQFGIAPGEITRFLQQGPLSAVLNRVVGGDPSAILGSLLSNGQVFLINPNGVVFGAGAVVDTAGLVVSSLNMADGDFLAGRLHFSGDGDAGAVTNAGRIHSSGGVVLIAPRIENSGLIETEGGGLLLAAGREVTITSVENPEITYQLRAPEDAVLNLGQLVTHGGAASIFAGRIRHSGDIDASGVTVDAGGRVRLVARADVTLDPGSRIAADGARGGSVVVESAQGTVMADGARLSATGSAGAGGEVRLLGERVALAGDARVDVSGRDGGGEVLVGGDYQGANPEVPNARFTFMGERVRIAADAGERGDGGTVILWADDTTRAHGSISATGGLFAGDGGFVEISGKHGLVFEAQVDTTAAAGASGTLLLDPDTINIIDGMGGTNDGNLPNFTAVGITTIGELALEGQNTNVFLQALDGITLESLTDGLLDMSGVTFGQSFTLQTTGAGDITFLDPNNEIRTAGGNINLEAIGTGSLTSIGRLTSDGVTSTPGGDFNLLANAGNIDLLGLVQSIGTARGNALITAGGSVAETVNGAIQVGNLTVNAQTGITLRFAGNNNVQQFNASNVTAGNIEFNNLNGPLTLGNVTNGAADGDIQFNSASQGAGTALTVTGAVQALNGTGSNVILEASGLLTIGGAANVRAGGTVFLFGNDQDIQGPVSGLTINVNPQAGGNGLLLGAADVLGNNVTELSQAEIDQLSAANDLRIGSGIAGNITVAGGISITSPAQSVFLGSFVGQGIDFNAPFDVGTRNLNLDATGAGTGDGEVRQSAAGVITAGVLTVNADQAVLLGNAVNQVTGLTVTSNAALSGGVQVTNNSGGVALALNNITSTNNAIVITNSGGTSITGAVNAGTANLTITENSRDINGGGGTATGNVVSLVAPAGGIGNGTKVVTNTATTLNVTTGGPGAAGNVFVEEVDAIATSNINLNTTGAAPQLTQIQTASGALTLDSNFGDPLDSLVLLAPTDAINRTAGTVSGVTVSLLAQSAIGAPNAAGSVRTATANLSAQLLGNGSISVDNTGTVDIFNLITPGGGVIDINQQGGSGAVTLSGPVSAGTGGPIRIQAASPLNVNANVTGQGSIELRTAGATPNLLTIAPGVLVNATGAGSTVDIISAGGVQHDGTVQSNQSNVVLDAAASYNMGVNGVARATLGQIDLVAPGGVGLGLLQAGATGSVNVTSSGGAISDANGNAVNVVADRTRLDSPVAVGSAGDPLEIAVSGLDSGSSTGVFSVASVGTSPLTLDSDITTTGGNPLILIATAGIGMNFKNLNSGGALLLDAGTGILQVDFSSLTAGSTLSARGAGIEFIGSTANAVDVDMVATNTVHLVGAFGEGPTPTDVSASNNVSIVAGNLLVEGGDLAGADAKLFAGNASTINAGNVTVRGGPGSAASIDPVTLTINAAGNILVQGGTGAGSAADLTAGTVNLNAVGGISVLGGDSPARVSATAGELNMVAGGPVTLRPGSDPFGDAVLAANGGLGTVNIQTPSCVGCVLLAENPFLPPQDTIADTGAFAAFLNINGGSPFVVPPPPPVVDSGPVAEPAPASTELDANDILVLRDLYDGLTDEGDGQASEDDEDPKQQCS